MACRQGRQRCIVSSVPGEGRSAEAHQLLLVADGRRVAAHLCIGGWGQCAAIANGYSTRAVQIEPPREQLHWHLARDHARVGEVIRAIILEGSLHLPHGLL